MSSTTTDYQKKKKLKKKRISRILKCVYRSRTPPTKTINNKTEVKTVEVVRLALKKKKKLVYSVCGILMSVAKVMLFSIVSILWLYCLTDGQHAQQPKTCYQKNCGFVSGWFLVRVEPCWGLHNYHLGEARLSMVECLASLLAKFII